MVLFVTIGICVVTIAAIAVVVDVASEHAYIISERIHARLCGGFAPRSQRGSAIPSSKL